MFTLSQPDQSACEVDEGSEVVGQFVVARGEATELFEPGKEIPNEMPRAIAVGVKFSQHAPVATRRNDRFGTPSFNGGNKGIGIVTFVAKSMGSELIDFLPHCTATYRMLSSIA